MNQITCTKRLILIVIVAISLTNIAYAQTIKSKTTQSPTKSIQNCGCDYMPLCNPFSEKIFDGKLYKGIKNNDGSIVYWNCENGVLTKKWYSNIEVFSHRLWEWRFEINDYVQVPVDYYKDETILNTLVVLKTNVPKGTSWSTPGSSLVFKIADKGIKYNYNSQEYTDVIKVQVLKGENVGSVNLGSDLSNVSFITEHKITEAGYHYWAKNTGWLYFEDVMAEIRSLEEKKKMQAAIDKEEALLKRKNTEEDLRRKKVMAKYDSALQALPKQQIPALIGLWERRFYSFGDSLVVYFRFNKDGTCQETGSFEIKTFEKKLLEKKLSTSTRYNYGIKNDTIYRLEYSKDLIEQTSHDKLFWLEDMFYGPQDVPNSRLYMYKTHISLSTDDINGKPKMSFSWVNVCKGCPENQKIVKIVNDFYKVE